MWNFLLDLVSDDGRADFEVGTFANIDLSSLSLGLLIGLIFGVILTLLITYIIIYTNKIMKDDNENNNDNDK